MSATLPPQPSPSAGAVNGMAPQPNPLQAKFQTVIKGATEIIQAMMRLPGVDQATVKQAAEKLTEGMVLLGKAVQGQQSGGAPPPTAPPTPPG